MRCLALLEAMAAKQEVLFVCRELAGNAIPVIESLGIRVYRIPSTEPVLREDAPGSGPQKSHWPADAEETDKAIRQLFGNVNWLVVDHYSLDGQWENRLRAAAAGILSIDDLADRSHDCDLLLDQNLVQGYLERYDPIVPGPCRRLLGPTYALLRSEFQLRRRQTSPRSGTVRRLFVCFGGSDPTGETLKALAAIRMLECDPIAIDVVVGPSNPHASAIREQCGALRNAEVHVNATNMAELMAKADLAIGAGGSTTWERCCLGLPAIAIAVAHHQEPVMDYLNGTGHVHYLGKSDSVTSDNIREALDGLLRDPGRLQSMSRKCMELVDGDGAARVARILSEVLQERA